MFDSGATSVAEEDKPDPGDKVPGKANSVGRGSELKDKILDERLPYRASQKLFRGGYKMSAIKIAAIALIAVGILALVYGGFSYTKDTTKAKVGPIELTVKDKQTVTIPLGVGVGAIVVGGVLLLVGGKRS